MEYIAGLYYLSGGIGWQVLGPMASDAKEEAVTISFPFHGRPPTARDARRIVREELSVAENDVKWFSVKAGKWVVDLAVMRSFFGLTAEKHAWLDGIVTIEPEYNVLPDTFKPAEMRGVLALVFDRSALREAEELHVPPQREKQQKFGILDAPNLFASDLEACRSSAGSHGQAVVYFDLDHFKNLNSALTEREVDRSILPRIHQCVRDSVTALGFAYAEGGDEFLVLLPNANEAIAVAVVEGLRAALTRLRFPVGDQEYRVTASFGLATTETWLLEELADAANRAKLEAKDGGRDRIVIAQPRPT